MIQSNPPSIEKEAFECPHCGAYTTQYWYGAYCKGTDKYGARNIATNKTLARVEARRDKEDVTVLLEYVKKLITRQIFLQPEDYPNVKTQVANLNLSICYHCKKNDQLIYPRILAEVTANSDMPLEIATDFNEARAIVGDSPRGAAALLRLCVQKLCKHLGEAGQNINDDIASLVSKGLSPKIQKSLDIVRVIGNEAVHPGTLDLSDDYASVVTLFGLVNSICDQMISHPKHIDSLYENLPPEKRAAIKKRDSKQRTEPSN